MSAPGGGVLDRLFGVHRMDGGSTLGDFVVVPCGLLVCALHLAVVYQLFNRRKTDVNLKVKSVTLMAIQSVSGVVWYVGFVARFGHFARTNGGLLSACQFWNYYVAIVLGFGVWTACILFRLLRLYCFFLANRSTVPMRWLGCGFKDLSFKADWWKILGLLCTPVAVVYGLLLPLFGDNVFKKVGGKYMCVYEGKLWATVDTAVFIAVWALLFYLVRALRHVHDQFGEYRSIRKALVVSASCLASLLFVEVTQIDGLWLGRSLVTCSVLASVTVFFYTQNKAEVTRLLIGDTTVDRTIAEQVSLAEADGTDEAILEGGVVSPPRTPHAGDSSRAYSAYDYGYNGESSVGMDVPPAGAAHDARHRGSQRKQQSEFTKAILLD